MNTDGTHICLNSFSCNDNKSSQTNSLLSPTTCSGLKGHHGAETRKNCVCVYVYTHTRSLYETDCFILVFNLMMVFQVETCS